jgi:serine/threonine protein kinase
MQVPPEIPGYELFQRLGGGPLTGVYAARECATDQPCAVKVLRNDWEDPSTALKLLQREARVGLKVRHPHLVRLRQAHVTRPPYFLVMELVEGESLRRRLRREYRLDPASAVWIGRQTAEALAALHRAGFVHGDVKPDNIRLVNDGTAVLIDLGFAHRPGENAALRAQGYVLGTANYLAPELCTSTGDGDQASDLFSLGLTFFEMLTGELPYPSGSLLHTLKQHAEEEPIPLRGLVKGLPAGLEHLVERLLQRQPSLRPRAGWVVQQLIGHEIATMQRRRSA